MSDHININHPDTRCHSRHKRIEEAELKAKLAVLTADIFDLENDMEAIFTRIERGDIVELHMPDNRVFVVSGKLKGIAAP